MLKRAITAVIIVLVTVPLCFLTHTWALPVAASLLALVAIYEMLGCIGIRKFWRVSLPTYALAVILPILCRLIPDETVACAAGAAMLFVFLFYLLSVGVFSGGALDAEKIFASFTPTFYVIAGFSSLVLLADASFGFSFQFFVVTLYGPWISDVFAYLCGRWFGRHKLIPSISPKKTVEGMIGGIVFTTLFTVLWGMAVNYFMSGVTAVSYLSMAIAGVLVSVMSQIGDLIMSFIKRKYGIKDFGVILPGHGGILDRFDSVLSVAPFMLFLTVFQDSLHFFQ